MRGWIVKIVILASCGGLVAAVFLVPLWGEKHRELDVSSGRLRERVFVFGIMVSEETRDTAFSRLVAKHVREIEPARYKTLDVDPLGLASVFVRQDSSHPNTKAFTVIAYLAEILADHPSLQEQEGIIVTRMLAMLKEGRPDEMMGYLETLISSVLDSTVVPAERSDRP